jgi:hypothetical protein
VADQDMNLPFLLIGVLRYRDRPAQLGLGKDESQDLDQDNE